MLHCTHLKPCSTRSAVMALGEYGVRFTAGKGEQRAIKYLCGIFIVHFKPVRAGWNTFKNAVGYPVNKYVVKVARLVIIIRRIQP